MRASSGARVRVRARARLGLFSGVNLDRRAADYLGQFNWAPPFLPRGLIRLVSWQFNGEALSRAAYAELDLF